MMQIIAKDSNIPKIIANYVKESTVCVLHRL